MSGIYCGLRAEFVFRHGHFMVLNDENGLNEQRLSRLQVNMLQANAIPRLLPSTVEQIDAKVKLYYNITGKRMLSQLLRQTNLNLSQYMQTILSIASALVDSKIYMLHEYQYALHPDFIFCGEDITDVYLVYVPLDHLPGKKTIQEELRHLAAFMLNKVDELHGRSLQAVMSYLMEEGFHVAGLKNLLLQQLTQGTPQEENGKQIDSSEFMLESGEAADDQMRFGANYSMPVVAQQPAFRQQSEMYVDAGVTEPDEMNARQTDHAIHARQGASRMTISVLVVAALCCAMFWKWYMDHPIEPVLYIASGLTLLMADVSYFVLRIWKPGMPPHIWGQQREIGSLPPSVVKQNTAAQEAPLFITHSDVIPKQPLYHGDSYQADQAAQHTTLLVPNDATVWLGDQGMMVEGAYLETFRSGSSKRIPINEHSFVIGRGGSGVHYVEESPGVSRAHVEIIRSNGEYWVKDLGSRNGTLLNGEQMIPYRMYSLTEGDIVKIVKTEFTFKMGS